MKNGMQKLIDGIIAFLLLACASVLLYRYTVIGGLFLTLLSVLYLIFVLARTSGGRLHFFRYRSGVISTVLPNLIKSIDAPLLIVGENNKIIWSNKRFENLSELSTYTTLPAANKIFDGVFSYENLEGCLHTGFELETNDCFFRVRILELQTKSKTYYAALCLDSTEEFFLRQEIKNNNAIVALIAVDNASELSQNGDETFRLTSAKINLALTEWAKTIQAILLEYEDGKFLMLMDQRRLAKIEESKFSIIDEISELSSGVYTLPLTISIGVSDPEGSFADKYASAMNALRMAFQKGGATAVVKVEDGYHSYGGKTKSVQKQTSIRSRICRDLLVDNIRTSSNVLIMGHRRPDFDSIASNIGMAKLVSYLGKPVNIITDVNEVNIANAFRMLDGFSEYDTMFVDANRGMDLMTPFTLLIITDASNPKNFYSEDLYHSAQRVIVIDHHTLDQHLDENVLTPTNIDPNASSASELVCEILELAVPDGYLRAEEAQLMMIGILLDTQFFSRDTGSRTFRACSYLRTAGADPAKAKLQFKTDLAEFERIDLFESSKYICKERFMIAFHDGEPDPNNMVAAAKCAERLVGIDGIVASFVLYVLDSGISLSARSDGTFNVLSIVRELGGGGHFQSAGARLTENGAPVKDMNRARAMLESAIEQSLES
ncbi:MAG: DHH family phosphoesterase [Clostridia bacterium]|nr:DHH family phosphoesterase [Clostridia bacterium]